MKKILFILVLSLIAIQGFAQCTGTVLNWVNPSFEGTPGTPHVTPPSWDICMPGVTPDTQPGCWGVTLAPTNGISYVGFCNQSGWTEGASQTLSSPMVPNTTYTFTLDLATTASTSGGITPGCIEMQIWGNMGGNTGCDQTELLWSSGDVYDIAHIDQWVSHTATLVPTQAWTHLLFMSHNLGCTYTPYIMMDNLSPVQPIADVPKFTWTDVCQGSTMSFTDQSTSIGTINAWDWDYGDGTPHGTAQNPTHVYSTPGTFNVVLTIYSSVPCTTTVTHAVTVYANPIGSIITTPASCGMNDGTATANPGGLTYNWSNSQTSQTINSLSFGTYTVTITDANGCKDTVTGTVNGSIVGTFSVSSTNENCGNSDGTATATLTGGTNPITYIWSNSMSTSTITGLTAGTYTVTVTDGNGCTGIDTVTIINIAGPSVPFTNIINETCTQGNGSVTASPIGGTSPYTYLWSNGISTATNGNLHAGSYTVTVTDGNNCTASNSITITDTPAQILTTSMTSANCGQSNGSATVVANGGSGSYTYLWSNGESTATISNIAAGSYTVTVDDGVCTVTSTILVTNLPGPNADFSVYPNILTIDDNQCMITDNSTNAIQWQWSFGDGSSATGIVNSHLYTSTGDFVIILTVTDANGCSDTTSQIIHVKPIFTIYIPNSFSPNGDGKNDVFGPTGLNIDLNNFQMIIYNRWGEEVYETLDLSKPWNGSKNNIGEKVVLDVFVYRIMIQELDGNKHEYIGRVTLLP